MFSKLVELQEIERAYLADLMKAEAESRAMMDLATEKWRIARDNLDDYHTTICNTRRAPMIAQFSECGRFLVF